MLGDVEGILSAAANLAAGHSNTGFTLRIHLRMGSLRSLACYGGQVGSLGCGVFGYSDTCEGGSKTRTRLLKKPLRSATGGTPLRIVSGRVFHSAGSSGSPPEADPSGAQRSETMRRVVDPTGVEPATPCLQSRCSPIELRARESDSVGSTARCVKIRNRMRCSLCTSESSSAFRLRDAASAA